MTLARLATEAGLTHGFLSKVERGLATPSIASLGQIARALGTSQVELLAAATHDSRTDSGPRPGPTPAPPDAPAQVQRAGEGITGAYGLGRAEVLTNGTRRLQPMICEGENTDPGDYYEHAEDEFVHVLGGSVRIDLGPHGQVTLGVGDSVYLHGGVPHRWCTAGSGRYRMFIVKAGPAIGDRGTESTLAATEAADHR